MEQENYEEGEQENEEKGEQENDDHTAPNENYEEMKIWMKRFFTGKMSWKKMQYQVNCLLGESLLNSEDKLKAQFNKINIFHLTAGPWQR